MGLSQSGEGDLSRAAIRAVAGLAAERGVVFSLSDDFDELLALNKANQDSWDSLMPQFHPDYFTARPAPAFWIKGVDRDGRVISARGYRRYDLASGQTMHDALTSLALFYDDPTKAGPLERVESDAVKPHGVTGSLALSGGLWIHPQFRRIGLASLMWPIGRSLTYDLWDVSHLFALIEDVRKMQAVLGFENMERGLRWSHSYVGDFFEFALVWWTRDDIARDVEAFLRKVNLGRQLNG